jgi:hypothetical protein
MTHHINGPLRAVGITMVLLATLLINPSPAHAASGGGCGPYENIDACISHTLEFGGKLKADFYANASPANSRCWVTLVVGTYGIPRKTKNFRVDRTGRFGPIEYNVDHLPDISGNGFAQAHVYNCNWEYQYSSTSPTIHYYS